MTPHRVAVVGAGMVGLATTWFLQERGVEMTVIDRHRVGAGASWGNAGWLAPSSTLGQNLELASRSTALAVPPEDENIAS